MGSVLSSDRIANLTSENLEIGLNEINSMRSCSTKEIGNLSFDITKIRIENEPVEDAYNLTKTISSLSRLKQVIIKGTGLNGKQIEGIVTALSQRKLRLIDFSGNHVSLRAAQVLRSMMAEGKIKRLHLKSCDMDGKKLREILEGFRQSNKKVKVLDISGNYVTKGVYDTHHDLLLHDNPIIWDRKVRESSWKRAKKNVGKAVTALTE